MRLLKILTSLILIFTISVCSLSAQTPNKTAVAVSEVAIKVDEKDGLITITNLQEQEYILRVYSTNGMLVVFEKTNDKEFTFNSREFDGDRFYYSIKIENTHIKKCYQYHIQ